MNKIIAQLFAARDTAHRLHLKSRSFAAHLALGDLYDSLLSLADTLAEGFQGKYGIQDIPNPEFIFVDTDNLSFIRQLATWAEQIKSGLNPADSYIDNEWDNVLSAIYKAKYKLENLS